VDEITLEGLQALNLPATRIDSMGGFGDLTKGTGNGFNLDKLATGIGAGMDLLNGFLAWKQYSLAKKQFQHNKGLSLANLDNQAALTQERLDTRAASRAGRQSLAGMDFGKTPQMVTSADLKKYG